MAARKSFRLLVWVSACVLLSLCWRTWTGLPSAVGRVSGAEGPNDGSVGAVQKVLTVGAHYLAGGAGDEAKRRDNKTTAAVVAALKKDDVRWMDRLGWEVWKYEVDAPKGEGRLRVPKNKGAEAMVYLTHIIDQYDNLTDRIVFLHPNRFQWHNDNPRYDGKVMLQNLHIQHVDTVGYTSLRCHWFQGCPRAFEPIINSTWPDDPKSEHMDLVTHLYSTAFPSFFPDLPFPSLVAAPCCSQFAVSRDAVLRNEKGVYVNVRNWLLNANIHDYYTGRVMEYVWHVLFGQQVVSCPTARDCYCKLYGACGLRCTSSGDCGRYLYPFKISGWRTLWWKVTHVFSV